MPIAFRGGNSTGGESGANVMLVALIDGDIMMLSDIRSNTDNSLLHFNIHNSIVQST